MISAGTILSAKDKSRGVAPHHRVDTSKCIVQPAESGKVLHTEV